MTIKTSIFFLKLLISLALVFHYVAIIQNYVGVNYLLVFPLISILIYLLTLKFKKENSFISTQNAVTILISTILVSVHIIVSPWVSQETGLYSYKICNKDMDKNCKYSYSGSINILNFNLFSIEVEQRGCEVNTGKSCIPGHSYSHASSPERKSKFTFNKYTVFGNGSKYLEIKHVKNQDTEKESPHTESSVLDKIYLPKLIN